MLSGVFQEPEVHWGGRAAFVDGRLEGITTLLQPVDVERIIQCQCYPAGHRFFYFSFRACADFSLLSFLSFSALFAFFHMSSDFLPICSPVYMG